MAEGTESTHAAEVGLEVHYLFTGRQAPDSVLYRAAGLYAHESGYRIDTRVEITEKDHVITRLIKFGQQVTRQSFPELVRLNEQLQQGIETRVIAAGGTQMRSILDRAFVGWAPIDAAPED